MLLVRKHICLVVTALLLLAGPGSWAELRQWTAKSGSTAYADFVALRMGAVYLRKADGKLVRVPLGALVDADQAFARSQSAGGKPNPPVTPPPASASLPAPGPRGVAEARGSVFRPNQFRSLGNLAVAKGQTVTFHTGGVIPGGDDTETEEPTVSGAATGPGSLGRSQSGQVELAVFAFDSIRLDQGAKIEVSGARGLVLVSTGAAGSTPLSISAGRKA